MLKLFFSNLHLAIHIPTTPLSSPLTSSLSSGGLFLYSYLSYSTVSCSTVSTIPLVFPLIHHHIPWYSTVSYRIPHYILMVFHFIYHVHCPISWIIYVFHALICNVIFLFFSLENRFNCTAFGFDRESLDRTSAVFTTTPSQPDLKDIYFWGI